MSRAKSVRDVEVKTPETLSFVRQGQVAIIIPGKTSRHQMDELRVPGAGWGSGDRWALVSPDPTGDQMRDGLFMVRDCGTDGKVLAADPPTSMRLSDWLWVSEP